jgi:hypothetical protein
MLLLAKGTKFYITRYSLPKKISHKKRKIRSTIIMHVVNKRMEKNQLSTCSLLVTAREKAGKERMRRKGAVRRGGVKEKEGKAFCYSKQIGYGCEVGFLSYCPLNTSDKGKKKKTRCCPY